MTASEKVAYIRGLMDAIEWDDSPNTKIMKSIVDVLEDLALTTADLEDGVAELSEEIDVIDEDLGALEDDFYGEDECDCCGDDDEPYYEVECPNCGDTICLDEDLLSEGEIECPNCGEKLEFEVECCDDGCSCDCESGKDE